MAEPGRREAMRLAARRLLRGMREGVLATCKDGQPHASLVTPAPAADGGPLMLLSGLAEHTDHLAAEPRCSLMVSGPAPQRNPQTRPRLSMAGRAVPAPERADRLRWLSRHPYAAFYADLADFSLWRLEPEAVSWVGGFGLAGSFAAEELLSPAAAVAAVGAAGPTLLARWNRDHGRRIDAIARRLGGAGEEWRIATIDPDGVDLLRGDETLRAEFAAPATDASGAEDRLAALTG